MSDNFFSTSKVLEGMLENLVMLSGADLDDLKDAITDELETRKRKQVIDLQKKAINALKDYYEAGGSLCSSLENFYIDESQEYDDDFYHIHLK